MTGKTLQCSEEFFVPSFALLWSEHLAQNRNVLSLECISGGTVLISGKLIKIDGEKKSLKIVEKLVEKSEEKSVEKIVKNQ